MDWVLKKSTNVQQSRVGSSIIKGRRTLLPDELTGSFVIYHSGYDIKNVLAAKGQVRFTHFFIENLGLTSGAYYLMLFCAIELNQFTFASAYLTFSPIEGKDENLINSLNRNGEPKTQNARNTVISSIGSFWE